MESIVRGRLPTVSVIHHDMGNDPSVSIGDFLRSLKRVPCPSFSERRSLNWKSRSRSLASRAYIPASTRNVNFPVGHDDTSNGDSMDQMQDITQLREEKPTIITPREGTAGHDISADTLSEQCPAGLYRCGGQQNTSDSLGVAQNTKPESRLPTEVVTYSSRKRKLGHDYCNEEPRLKGKERRRRCADLKGLLLIHTVEGITDEDHTPKQRSQPQRPLSEIKHDIQLSKSVSVNPAEFRFPPATPSTTRRATWKLGSGFKGQSRRQALIGGSVDRTRESRKQVNLDPKTTPIEKPTSLSLRPQHQIGEIPAAGNGAYPESLQTASTGERTGR